jgi:hypothetical protein
MGSNGATKTVYVSDFYAKGGTRQFLGSSAAVNYGKPLSGWGYGGHGDTGIPNQTNFIQTAGADLPVACGTCHDGTTAHFPAEPANPYRMTPAALGNTLPGFNANVTRVTNLCTQTNCHPKTVSSVGGTGPYGVLDPGALETDNFHTHPSDYYPISATPAVIWISSATNRTMKPATASTVNPQYDPDGIAPALSTHIDRYVDHWGYWGKPATTANGFNAADDIPWLPLGDSLTKTRTGEFNNAADVTNGRLTCITCHNPHGSDPVVAPEDPAIQPGAPDELQAVPNNKMLRLRKSGGELCSACH